MEIRNSMLKYYHIELTNQQIVDLLTENQNFAISFYEAGMANYVMEELADILAMKFLGRKFPVAHDKNVNSFWKLFHKQARLHGYKTW